ncbi:hypothetical protein WKR88_15550 [Trinickia caryophylli]|uniref:Uncharacterized protein n=1 Tax=Trinickia caryophylli TaxID=28094 RepID=A0A1X7D444_TRICW|nr:hypothetical protein [Trinickia caryophylli]TRX15158.1 hypothetical protein FNF07_28620 [Trinickia caryophylli]WQE15022.1 hypothetical protein U0034_20945 [Trinickia caryophylli]GLU31245.1 hypothetical protein Busp01_10870 [Trinickia caryophylli]SMF08589.1 hypothetical protein SAMN06295900_102371 [Trinickia caryophylli]
MPFDPILPHRVKPSELELINPVWIDIEANPKEFVADQSLTYLWVLRDDGKVILGIEEPWKYPQAFSDAVREKLDEMRDHYEAQYQQNEKDGSGGHPTLAAWFDETGRADPRGGYAFLGGELKYDGQIGGWMLSNRSGRFGRGAGLTDGTVSEEAVLEAMSFAAQVIEAQTGLNVSIEVVRK